MPNKTFHAFEFYATPRLCPQCYGKVVTQMELSRETMQGPLGRMGLRCQCVQCATRFRATSALPFAWVSWLGPLGKWLWWQSTALESTTPSTK